MQKNNRNRILIIIAVSFVLLLIISKKAGWIGAENKIEVLVEKAGLRTIIEMVSASGKVQPEVEVKISPDVSGEIVELYVKEGQQVKKGDVLCKINPDIYTSMQDRMLATVNTSKANWANSKARLSQAKSAFVNAESSFGRNKKLFEQSALSQAEYDNANAQFLSAKAEVDAAEESVSAAEYNVKNAEASLKEASVNLTRTTIVSPVNGKVSKLNVEAGDRVVGTSQMAGTELMRIANLNEMEVNVDVNENDIVRVHVNDTADIQIDAYAERKFMGVVTEIANTANASGLSADQVTNFAVKVRILSESYKDLIPANNSGFSPFRPGMTATVDIKTKTVTTVISVPIQAITTREDTVSYGKIKKKEIPENQKKDAAKSDMETKTQEYIFVKVGDRAVLRAVKTGIQDNNYIELLSGIKTADEIIYGPYSAVSKMLKNLMPIKQVEKEDLFETKEAK